MMIQSSQSSGQTYDTVCKQYASELEEELQTAIAAQLTNWNKECVQDSFSKEMNFSIQLLKGNEGEKIEIVLQKEVVKLKSWEVLLPPIPKEEASRDYLSGIDLFASAPRSLFGTIIHDIRESLLQTIHKTNQIAKGVLSFNYSVEQEHCLAISISYVDKNQFVPPYSLSNTVSALTVITAIVAANYFLDTPSLARSLVGLT